MRTYGHWIDGSTVMSDDVSRIERRSPSNNVPVASFALGDANCVDAAVNAARRTFEDGVWRHLAGSERGAILMRMADLIAANADKLAKIESEEAGKPISVAQGEVAFSLDVFRYAASLAWDIPGRLMTHDGPDKMGIVAYEPRGVAALITPWNYPLVCLLFKLPYALAAGCSVVIKPSEYTSGTALEIAALAQEAGVPDGVLNIVTGTGADVGDPLTGHPDVNMISFTGSTTVGKHIARRAADSMKRVSLELGGKGANVVFADADLDAAVEGAVQGFTINQGQECCAGGRILIEQSIYQDFVQKLLKRTAQVQFGDMDHPETEIGPMIHEAHLKHVLQYIEKGAAAGATLLAGGARHDDNRFADGLYVMPTIFGNVTPDMEIFQEEIFGPVATIVTFETLDEAVALVNNTRYGLANGVWTSNIDQAMAMVRRVRSGMVYVNCYLQTISQLPFGGVKESGTGRENGLDGLMEFMDAKAAFLKLKTEF